MKIDDDQIITSITHLHTSIIGMNLVALFKRLETIVIRNYCVLLPQAYTIGKLIYEYSLETAGTIKQHLWSL